MLSEDFGRSLSAPKALAGNHTPRRPLGVPGKEGDVRIHDTARRSGAPQSGIQAAARLRMTVDSAGLSLERSSGLSKAPMNWDLHGSLPTEDIPCGSLKLTGLCTISGAVTDIEVEPGFSLQWHLPPMREDRRVRHPLEFQHHPTTRRCTALHPRYRV